MLTTPLLKLLDYGVDKLHKVGDNYPNHHSLIIPYSSHSINYRGNITILGDDFSNVIIESIGTHKRGDGYTVKLHLIV